jgi:hypothetical protein
VPTPQLPRDEHLGFPKPTDGQEQVVLIAEDNQQSSRGDLGNVDLLTVIATSATNYDTERINRSSSDSSSSSSDSESEMDVIIAGADGV